MSRVLCLLLIAYVSTVIGLVGIGITPEQLTDFSAKLYQLTEAVSR